jgi:hypothetical protein
LHEATPPALAWLHGSVGADGLTRLERELLELCSIDPETTTTLHEEMLELPHDRAVVEAVLRSLVERRLMVTYRGVYRGVHRPRGGPPENRVYEDDWWEVTEVGRRAVQSR